MFILRQQAWQFYYTKPNNMVKPKEQPAPEALKASKKGYPSLLDSMLEGCQVISFDWRYLYLNDVAAKHNRYPKKKLLGRTMMEMYPGIENTEMFAKLKDCMERRIPHRIENLFTFPSGSQCWFELSIEPTTQGILILSMDITGRKMRKEVLRASEAKYKSLIDNIKLGVFRSTPEPAGRLLEVNPAVSEITGYSRGELLQMNAAHLYANPEERQLVLDELASSRGRAAKEIRFSKKDGTEIVVLDRKTAVRDDTGRVVYFDGIIEDITERRRIEGELREAEALRELDRLRSQLLANVSHELRTPLTSIKGFATTLLRQDVRWSEAEQRDFIQAINLESERLTRLISDLLDMSRIEGGALSLERTKCQITELTDPISGSLTSLAERHRLQVIVPADLPPVFVDEVRIGQVITNLVENAAKFSREGSQITIEAWSAGNQVIVSVTDRGEGIPSWFQDKVFDRFYQAGTIADGRKSGTGLGLALTQQFVKACGGTIWLESEHGKGSKFIFTLPLAQPVNHKEI
jgi:PAS domain S-box-containing protein